MVCLELFDLSVSYLIFVQGLINTDPRNKHGGQLFPIPDHCSGSDFQVLHMWYHMLQAIREEQGNPGESSVCCY